MSDEEKSRIEEDVLAAATTMPDKEMADLGTFGVEFVR